MKIDLWEGCYPSRWKGLMVGKNWTNDLLTKYMRYWSNLKITGAFSFDDYRRSEKIPRSNVNQEPLFTE